MYTEIRGKRERNLGNERETTMRLIEKDRGDVSDKEKGMDIESKAGGEGGDSPRERE